MPSPLKNLLILSTFLKLVLSNVFLLDTVFVGLNLFLDLVVSVDAGVDLSAGFEFSFPNGASLELDLLADLIKNHDSPGALMNDLPITVLADEAKLQAAIRCRVEAGTSISLLGIGYDFELGVHADLLQCVTEIGRTDECPLSITGSCDINIGSYATSVSKINFGSFGIAPTAAVTLNFASLAPICTTRPTSATTMGDRGGFMPTGSAPLPGTSDGASSGIDNGSDHGSGHGSGSDGNQGPMSSNPPGTGRFANGTIPTASLSSGASATGSLIGTITNGASLSASTVYGTQATTITSCAASVIHCRASLASTVVVTQTVIDYTTICPVSELGKPTTGPVSSRLPPISAKFSSKVQPSSIPCTITLTPIATTSTSIFDVPVPSSFSVSGNRFPTTDLASLSAAPSTELSGSAPSSVVGSGSFFPSSPAATSTGNFSGFSSVPGSSPS